VTRTLPERSGSFASRRGCYWDCEVSTPGTTYAKTAASSKARGEQKYVREQPGVHHELMNPVFLRLHQRLLSYIQEED
jgi:hypothetical protein